MALAINACAEDGGDDSADAPSSPPSRNGTPSSRVCARA